MMQQKRSRCGGDGKCEYEMLSAAMELEDLNEEN